MDCRSKAVYSPFVCFKNWKLLHWSWLESLSVRSSCWVSLCWVFLPIVCSNVERPLHIWTDKRICLLWVQCVHRVAVAVAFTLVVYFLASPSLRESRGGKIRTVFVVIIKADDKNSCGSFWIILDSLRSWETIPTSHLRWGGCSKERYLLMQHVRFCSWRAF